LAPDGTPALLYLPTLAEHGARLTLAPADSHYVSRVCRARAGERLEATDGCGARTTLLLVEVGEVVVAEVISVVREEPERRCWLLCGAPEGERADWLVEKLAELGVARFVPVDCARARWRRASGRKGRWERLAVAALRQSRRSHLMAIEEPAPLSQVLAGLPAGGPRWLADAAGGRLGPGSAGTGGVSVGLVGPAEGLSEGEKAAAVDAGFTAVRLAGARLRCETAALAVAAWWAGQG
jgi:16S rRNA (uracil1498-N3)-methyltransferase